MLQIALLGIVTVFIALLFKNVKSEYAIFISLTGCILIFFAGFHELENIIHGIHQLLAYIALPKGYIAILFKILGITYLAEFSSNLCKDAGYSAIGGQIELVSKLTILSISMPILLALLETIQNLF